MESNSIGILIISFNEDIHLERCIENAKKLSLNIFVVDSFSTDKTIQILQKKHVKFMQHPFSTHAKQINFGIHHFPYPVEWLVRLDCDEFLSDELIREIKSSIQSEISTYNGFFVQRKVNFLEGILHYGMINPIWLLRVWKKSDGKCNDLWMDEKIELNSPHTTHLKGILYDHNLQDITWWTQKHNQYAVREAYEILRQKYGLNNPEETNTMDRKIVKIKKLYNHLPIFVRPFLLFIYAYFIKLGFLDGRRGLIWNFLQVFWYRFLVDVKVLEIEIQHQFDSDKIMNTLNNRFEN